MSRLRFCSLAAVVLVPLACTGSSGGTSTTSASIASSTPKSSASAPAVVASIAPSASAAPSTSTVASSSAVASSTPASRCPAGMKLVVGEYCRYLEHKCVRGRGDKAGVYCPGGCDIHPQHCAEWLPGYAHCLGSKPIVRDGEIVRWEPENVHLEVCMDDHEWPNVEGEKPKVFVSYWDSEKLCASVGKRTCTSAEFTLACEGPERRPTGYGWKIDPAVCNVEREPRSWKGLDVHEPAVFSRLDQREAIGARPQCVSPYGVHDLVGNVDEWTRLDPTDAHLSGHPSQLKGGYYAHGAHPYCRAHTDYHPPEFEFFQIGTRCCKDPAPAPAPAR